MKIDKVDSAGGLHISCNSGIVTLTADFVTTMREHWDDTGEPYPFSCMDALQIEDCVRAIFEGDVDAFFSEYDQKFHSVRVNLRKEVNGRTKADH